MYQSRVDDVMLECELAKGIFSLVVQPQLPLPGLSMILGNDICGGRVWPTVSAAPVVASQPLEVASLSSAQEIFLVCAMTRVHSKEPSVRNDAASAVESIPLPKLLAME